MPGPAERLPLTTRRGFAAFAEASTDEAPHQMDLDAYRALGMPERRGYDLARRRHHSRLGPYRLEDARRAMDEILDLVDQNVDLPESRIRPGAAIDGEPALGKTTVITHIGANWHRTQREENPEGLMADGQNLHVPVCYVSLPGDCTIKGLNQSIAAFYELPGVRRETALSLGARIKRTMRECGTSLVLIDDLHFITLRTRDGRTLSDHLKNLMSEVPATFVYAGVELEKAGIFGSFEHGAMRNVSANQTGERLRRFPVSRIDYTTAEGRRLWHSLVKAIDRDLVLCSETSLTRPETAEYLHTRTAGSIGALADLIRLSVAKVVRQEQDCSIDNPVLDISTLDTVELSYGTEQRSRRGKNPITKTGKRMRAA